MDAIIDFVTAFARDYEKYLSIEKEVKALCEEVLKDFQCLLSFRVKKVYSLEKKLKDRNKNYNDESDNVADIVDLVAGRIILAESRHFQRVEHILKQKFILRGQIQHPKPGQRSVNLQSRFRGYGGRHLHLTQKDPVKPEACNPFIEIQLMTPFMWGYAIVAHDTEYKKLHGESSEDVVASLELLKGVANLGEIGLEMFNRHFLPTARLSLEQTDVDLNLPKAIQAAEASVRLDENDKQCIRDLRLTDPRHDKQRIEASKDQLLEGSCSWVLDDAAFVDWWDRDDSRLLWIHGDPGKGKTMMMMALISEVTKKLNHSPGLNVLAYFFCQNTSVDLNTTVAVLRGLIYLLVDQEKKLVRHVRKYYDGAGARIFEGPNVLYALRTILSDILKDESLENVVLMVDALDECDVKIHELLDWIVCGESQISPKVKWLTTSRNEPAFTERLGHGRQLHTSLELNSKHVARAVHSFIDYKVKGLADLKSYGSRLQIFVRRVLLEKAEDTFLWVALVCKELFKVRQHKVRDLLEKLPAGLMPLYARMLKMVVHQEDRNDVELSQRILSSVTLALRPLHLQEIVIFAKLPGHENVEDLVGLCGSFLTIRGEIVYLVHQSAKDYLDDDERREVFPSGRNHQHASITRLCMKLMSSTLRKDICNLRTPGYRLCDIERDSIGVRLPLYAQYACVYWVDHLHQAGTISQETFVLGEHCLVLEFFRVHFLHWLEALTLLRKLSEAILAIRSLGSMQMLLIATTVDMFIRSLDPATGISQGIIEEQYDRITKMTFSSDGRLLASASGIDYTIRIWDPLIGVARGSLAGHLEEINLMAFAPLRPWILASGSLDMTIKIWDSSACTILHTLNHSTKIHAMIFDPFDDRLLASVESNGHSIDLWDTSEGIIKHCLEGHSGMIDSIVFSPNQQFLVSVSSDDKTIRIWDQATGTSKSIIEDVMPVLHGRPEDVPTRFSPDGRLLAVSFGISVSLWDPVTRDLHSTLEGHSNDVLAMNFSRDGHLLATGSRDRTVRLWDPAKLAVSNQLDADPLAITAIVFSPCGKFVASGSDSVIVRWDSAMGVGNYVFNEQGNSYTRVETLIFSPSSQILASGFSDGTIRLWDYSVTSVSQVTLEGHQAPTSAIIFSPDGLILASASEDQVIKIWNTATWESFDISDGDPDCGFEYIILAFSADSKTLAVSIDDRVQLWDVSTGTCQTTLSPLEFNGFPVEAMTISPDGQLMAIADGRTVKVWNINDKSIIQQHELFWGGKLSFDAEGSQLETINSLIRISPPFNTSGHESVSITDSYAIDTKKEWVTYRGCNVLNFPHNHRPHKYAIHNNLLVLGSEAGIVTFFHFSSTVAPPHI
ncbi:hypothetical protein G7Y79_00064g094120 [Physcia stellaris]|nr:hypothetical protein G7Y79_00064g094120 [Physcia stellaris]